VTAGLVDVGRAIFAYNEISAVARYGARWGAVVGGTCSQPLGTSTSDWCNQIGGQSGTFWNQDGNRSLQGAGAECPAYSVTPADWYTVSSYIGTSATTIVGALANHFDSSSTTRSTIVGRYVPGLDLTKLHVCIELSHSAPPAPGDAVTVDIYYPFAPAGGLIFNRNVDLESEAQWEVE
jgi:hypothetical protein